MTPPHAKAGKPLCGFPAPFHFGKDTSYQNYLSADKHRMGLSALSTILQDRRERSRTGASPFISALMVAVCPAIFPECGHSFGPTYPEVRAGTKTEVPYTPCPLSCRFKRPCPPRRQWRFRSNADRAYNTLHLASKVVCQKGRCPLWIPPQQTALCLLSGT